MLNFKTKQQLMSYTSKMKKNLQDGELASLETEKKMLVWRDNNWCEVQTEGHSNVQMTMYEINKQIMAQLPAHNEEDLKKDADVINEFYDIDKSEFYMLLCKEQSYYTILRRKDASGRLGSITTDLLIEIGHSILSVENVDNAEIEIWSKDSNDEVWCLHLFNYEAGVVDFGE